MEVVKCLGIKNQVTQKADAMCNDIASSYLATYIMLLNEVLLLRSIEFYCDTKSNYLACLISQTVAT